MESVSPVWTEKEVPVEKVIALDQPEYLPLIVLPVKYGCGCEALVVRFQLSPSERQAIAEGADLLVEQLNFKNPYIPIIVEAVMPGEYPKRMENPHGSDENPNS